MLDAQSEKTSGNVPAADRGIGAGTKSQAASATACDVPLHPELARHLNLEANNLTGVKRSFGGRVCGW